jgi:hypothetical protein
MKLLVTHFSLSSFYFISFAQICSSAPYSLTSPFGILPLMSEVKFVSRPHETTGKVQYLCLFRVFVNMKWGRQKFWTEY